MNQKGSLAVLILLLCSLISVGIFLFSYQQTRPTNEQKIQASSVPSNFIQDSKTIQKLTPMPEKLNLPEISKYQNLVANITDGKLRLIDIGTKQTIDLGIDGVSFSSASIRDSGYIFSPDKTVLLVRRLNNIWEINLDNKSTRNLTNINDDLGVYTCCGRFSPNGKFIYYSLQGGSLINEKDGLRLIYPDGSKKTLEYITNPKGWMKDSKGIIFTDSHFDNLDWDSLPTKIYDIETGNMTALVDTNIDTIAWSDDNSRGVFCSSNLFDCQIIKYNFPKDTVSFPFLTIDHVVRQQSEGTLDPKTKDYSLEIWDSTVISPDGQNAILTKRIQPYINGIISNDMYFLNHVEVYLWNTETKQKTKLPIQISARTKAFWSKDSQNLIYIKPISPAANPNFGEVFIFNLASKKEDQITILGNFDLPETDY